MTAQAYRNIVARLRNHGIAVNETQGCYGRNNGAGYNVGVPVGSIAHHYVCSLNPDPVYINGLVNNLVSGKVIPWFVDVNGQAHLIQSGPANHAGVGNRSVLEKIKRDERIGRPPGKGDYNGNRDLSGIEGQHPGDSTPWPEKLLNTMAAVHAAECIEFGWTVNRICQHWKWTTRKIDMSYNGGPADVDSDLPYLARVSAWIKVMNGEKPEPEKPDVKPEPKPEPIEEDDEMMLRLAIAEDATPSREYAWNPALGKLTHIKDWDTLHLLINTKQLREEKVTLNWGYVKDIMLSCGLTNAETDAQFSRAGFKSK